MAKSTGTSDAILEQVKTAGNDLKIKAGDMASSSADAVKQHAASVSDAAKQMASDAGDKLEDAVEDKKHAGADYVGRIAETMRRVGHELEKDMPLVAPYVRRAAAQVDNVGTTIRDGNMRDLVDGVQDFARRQPFAFLSITALAGFAAVRFIKSAPSSDTAGATATARNDSGKGYRDEFSK